MNSGFDVALSRVKALQQAIASVSSPRVATAKGSDAFAAVLDRAAGGSTAIASGDRAPWARDMLSALGMPQSSENVRALVAWAQAEGTSAGNNPLATTQGLSGATEFNSVGVKNYPSYADGIRATVQTLTNGLYGPILDALRRGTSAKDVGRAVAASPWGTGGGVLAVLGSSQ